jgi:hypothetical protein
MVATLTPNGRPVEGPPVKNHYFDLRSGEVLLLRNILIDGDQHPKAGGFGGIQKAPFFSPAMPVKRAA